MLKIANAPGGLDEAVILLDASGEPSGSTPKLAVHGPNTPLHLGFSCYLFDTGGRVLFTRRARGQDHMAVRVDERVLRPPATR